MRAVNRSKRSQDLTEVLTLESYEKHYTLGPWKIIDSKVPCQGICFISRRVADSLRDPSIWSLEASFSFCWLRREVPSFFFASQKIQGNKNQSEELIFCFLSRSSFWMVLTLGLWFAKPSNLEITEVRSWSLLTQPVFNSWDSTVGTMHLPSIHRKAERKIPNLTEPILTQFVGVMIMVVVMLPRC